MQCHHIRVASCESPEFPQPVLRRKFGRCSSKMCRREFTAPEVMDVQMGPEHVVALTTGGEA